MGKESDETKKTASDDGTVTPAKETEPSKTGNNPFTQADIDKAIDIGMAKGADKGRKEAVKSLLEDLGVETVDVLKANIKKGGDALEKLDTTRSKAEKTIDEYRLESEARFKEFKDKWEPIAIKNAANVQKQEATDTFNSLKVSEKNRDTLRAFMKLYDANEGESFEDHAKRVMEMKKDLFKADTNTPADITIDETTQIEKDENDRFLDAMHNIAGGKPDDLK